jgi:hypothetical protein
VKLKPVSHDLTLFTFSRLVVDVDRVRAVRVLVALRVLDAHQVRIGQVAEVASESENVVARVVHRLHHLTTHLLTKIVPKQMRNGT